MKAAKDRKERDFYDQARKDNIVGRSKNATGVVGRAPQGSNFCPGQSVEVRGKSVLRPLLGGGCWYGRKVAMTGDRGGFRSDCYRCGKRSFGFFWMLGTVCVYSQPPRNGMPQGGTGRMVSSSSSFRRKSQRSSVSWFGLEPSIRPHVDLFFFLLQKEPVCVP